MSNEHADKGPTGERKKYEYFVDQTKYEADKTPISGAEIKAEIKAAIPGFNSSFQLFVESKGAESDRPIGDSDQVPLDHGAPHLYTAPPATFGGV